MGISSVLGTGALVPAGYGFRNLIINGAMQIAQRGTSASGKTGGGYYTADRWKAEIVSQGTWTQTVENDAPTGSGFRKSLKMLCTTADASPTGSDELSVQQTLEGQNLQAIKKGTSSAEQVTLTFWVKSNVTGTYVAMLYDLDNARFCSASYSISASATWEKKTIVIPADTTGAFDNDNNASLLVRFFLGAGPNFASGTLQTTWGTDTNANRAAGQTNLAAATNNYWQITGVQLEVGPVATAYEFKPIDVEIAQCQRYFQSLDQVTLRGVFSSATAVARAGTVLPTQMRGAPVVALSGTIAVFDGSGIGTITALGTYYSTANAIEIDSSVATGTFATYRPFIAYIGGSTNSLTCDAEL